MTEIVGGLDIKDLLEGGTVIELKPPDHEEDEQIEDKAYMEELGLYAKMEALDLDMGTSYEGKEPFDELAKKMSNLTSSGKIKKRVLRGGYDPKAVPPCNVKIHYNAYVEFSGLPFDSTYIRKKPFSFDVEEGQVIEGLDKAVQSMQVNEKSQFLIHPDLAYRESGLNRIPPNSTILFEIELLGIMEVSAEKAPKENEREFAQVYPYCLGQCVKGKRMFRLKDYQGAIKEYSVAVEKLEEVILNNYDEQLQSDELLVRLHTNLLICYTHVQNPKKACLHAQSIYDMSKDNTFKVSAKVYFNHAKCLRMLGDFQRAEDKLNRAKKLEPKNSEILQEYLAIRKAADEYKRKMTAMGRILTNTS